MSSNKTLTFEERKYIEKGLKEGKSCSQIAREMGRGKTTVVNLVHYFGRENFTAEKSEERFQNLRKDRYINLRNTLKIKNTNHPASRIKNRIENIEMQLEIMHDTLKEILEKL